MQSVTMLSPFGPAIRGVSPYADQLFSALCDIDDLDVGKLDYHSLYPAVLFPASTGNTVSVENPVVRWNQLASWKKAANVSAPVMHMQYWTSLSAHYLIAIAHYLHRQGKRYVVTVHNPASHEAIPVLSIFERRLLRLADRIIVHSESGSDILCATSPSLKDRIRVIAHGVAKQQDTGLRSGDHALADLSPDRRYVLTFGNLRGYKGIPTLLRAWQRVISKNQDADLIIAGRFWDKGQSLTSYVVAKMLGTRKVAQQIKTMLGNSSLNSRVILRNQFIADDVIDACCRIAEVAVFPYDKFSGQSGAATRAASWGTPLIVSRTGALPSLAIDDDFIIRPGDCDALAQKLERLLSGSIPLKEIRGRQIARIEPCYWNQVAEQHAAVYRELVESHNSETRRFTNARAKA